MTNQSNAAAERSVHVERGPRRIPGESFLVEVSPGVFQIKALAEALRERDEARVALLKIKTRVERLTGGLTYTEVAVRDIARAALAAKEPGDERPRCRTLACGLYEVEIDPPANPRIWACRNPGCDRTIRAQGARP